MRSRSPRDRPRRRRPNRLVRFAVALLAGGGLALLVFVALPFMQVVAGLGQKSLMVRQVTVSQPPPPPPALEEPPPPEEPEPEEQPQMEEMAQPLSLGALEMSLNPGGGGGGALGDALAAGMASRAADAFSVADLDQKPRPVYQVAPKVPDEVRRQKLSGVVKVEATVDTAGRVSNPRVVQSLAPPLDRAALDAVRQWRFEPGTRAGRKVPSKVRVPFRFDA